VAFALPKFFPAGGDSGGASLGSRLHAWWNGYDLVVPDRESLNLDDADAGKTSDIEAADGAADAPGADPNEWSAAQKELAEALWTPGFIVPGGPDYVQELVGFCSLTPAETMLEIGLGMGGGTRAIIGKFGNYVTGYEDNQALAEEARKQAVTHDIDGKLDVINQPLSEIELKKGYFRAALIRDVLCTIEDKEAVIDEICQSLKAGEAYMIVTDFMFDPSNMTPEVKTWIDGERCPVYPWKIESLKSALESRDVMVRIAEDESDRYCSMVTGAWSNYLADLKNKEVTPELGQVVSAEADFWSRRTAALQSGGLRYFRIEAVKNS